MFKVGECQVRLLRCIFLLLLVFTIVSACAPESDDSTDESSEPANDDDVSDDDDENYDPGKLGPYAIGNATRLFIDTTRWDVLVRGHRQVLTEIWYPVLPEEAVGNFDTPGDMFGKWETLVCDLLSIVLPDEEIDNFSREMRSIRNAPLAPDGPFPIVIYSHGNAGIRFQAYTMFEHLASHGYIVVAPDHTGNAFVTALPDKLVIYNPLMMVFDFLRRQEDIFFLMDAMYWLNEFDSEGVFTGALDLENAAVSGHSFGGNTALEVFRRDPRFSACIPFAGPDFPIIDEEQEKGALIFVAMEDHTLPDYIPLHSLIYSMMPSPKALIQLFNAGHYSFTDVCSLVPTIMGTGDGCGTGTSIWDETEFEFVDQDTAWLIINSYVTAWLDFQLKGNEPSDILFKNGFVDYMDFESELY